MRDQELLRLQNLHQVRSISQDCFSLISVLDTGEHGEGERGVSDGASCFFLSHYAMTILLFKGGKVADAAAPKIRGEQSK